MKAFYKKSIISTSLLPLGLMCIPCGVFLWIIFRQIQNLPYYDDFSVVLMPLNWLLERVERRPQAFWNYLHRPNAGHIPLITHWLAWWQVKWLGAVNFRWSTILGDCGLILSIIALVVYLNGKKYLTLWQLVPVPFFLTGLAHWEAMDFMVPAWQFYWGALLFPLLSLMAAAEGFCMIAGVCYAAALFLTSSAIVVFPIVLMGFFVQKKWKEMTCFFILAGLATTYFLYIAIDRIFGKELPGMDAGLPDVNFVVGYALAFLGNIISNGEWDLRSYTTLHQVLGGVMLPVSGVLLWTGKTPLFLKSIILYVLILAIMAAVIRGGALEFVPSRYALLALFAWSCLYAGSIVYLKADKPMIAQRCFALTMLFSVCLWAVNTYQGLNALIENRIARGEAATLYQSTREGSNLDVLLWDWEFGVDQLRLAKQQGVYDIDAFRYEPLK